MQKPAPVYSAALLLHPERDTTYVHFENAAAHPFQGKASGIPRVNAWWLAEAGLAAYWPPESAAVIFGRAGLQCEFIAAGSTECYVTWQDAAVIVSFRGTQPDQWGDIRTDLRFTFTRWSRGRVHTGFSAALESVWTDISRKLAELSAGRTVWFCGHSLGGALAVLAADRFSDTRGVCTIGCPRVGDDAFMAAFNGRFTGRALRYVNNCDAVTHLPPGILGYEHVGSARFIAEDGVISDRPSPFAAKLEEPFTTTSRLIHAVVDAVEDAARRVPSLALDHMPKAYAIWTWNDYDRNG